MTTLIPQFDIKNGGLTPTGSVNRPINEKLTETISVLDFGAIADGINDDTVAFNNAWASENPKAILVPAGSYKITGTVTGKFYSFGVVTIITGTVTTITNLVP